MKSVQSRPTACPVNGVKRLNGYIYIICGEYPNLPTTFFKSIRIYEDTPPFDFLILKLIEEVNEPWGCAFDAELGCLYISDETNIWKFTIGDHKLTKWLSYGVRPYGVTVFTDGQVAAIRSHETSADLEIYGSNSVFIRRITLSKNVTGLSDPILLGNINNVFLVMSFGVFRHSHCHSSLLVFSLVSRNASTTDPQIIGQVNYTHVHYSSNSYWRWKVNASMLDVYIQSIYHWGDEYIIVAEEILRILTML